MCRSIKTLANFAPPASDEEIRAAALQCVRKLSGAHRPSRVNEPAFEQAVDEVAAAASRLLHSLTTNAPPRNRDEEARRAQERARRRFAARAWSFLSCGSAVGSISLRATGFATRSRRIVRMWC